MACVIDNLQTVHRVRIVRDFSDARGTRWRAGETAILRKMDLAWARQGRIEVERLDPKTLA